MKLPFYLLYFILLPQQGHCCPIEVLQINIHELKPSLLCPKCPFFLSFLSFLVLSQPMCVYERIHSCTLTPSLEVYWGRFARSDQFVRQEMCDLCDPVDIC